MPYSVSRKGRGIIVKNLETGKVTHYRNEQTYMTGMRIRGAIHAGWKPKGLAAADKATRTRVASKGGRSKHR